MEERKWRKAERKKTCRNAQVKVVKQRRKVPLKEKPQILRQRKVQDRKNREAAAKAAYGAKMQDEVMVLLSFAVALILILSILNLVGSGR